MPSSPPWPLFSNATMIYALTTSRWSYCRAVHPGSHLKCFQKITLWNKATAILTKWNIFGRSKHEFECEEPFLLSSSYRGVLRQKKSPEGERIHRNVFGHLGGFFLAQKPQRNPAVCVPFKCILGWKEPENIITMVTSDIRMEKMMHLPSSWNNNDNSSCLYCSFPSVLIDL